MHPRTFATKLKQLGLRPHDAHLTLGIARSSVFKIVAGDAEVPLVVARLIDMYERHGIPDEHKEKPRR